MQALHWEINFRSSHCSDIQGETQQNNWDFLIQLPERVSDGRGSVPYRSWVGRLSKGIVQWCVSLFAHHTYTLNSESTPCTALRCHWGQSCVIEVQKVIGKAELQGDFEANWVVHPSPSSGIPSLKSGDGEPLIVQDVARCECAQSCPQVMRPVCGAVSGVNIKLVFEQSSRSFNHFRTIERTILNANYCERRVCTEEGTMWSIRERVVSLPFRKLPEIRKTNLQRNPQIYKKNVNLQVMVSARPSPVFLHRSVGSPTIERPSAPVPSAPTSTVR